MKNPILPLLAICLTVASCGTARMSFNSLAPAPVNIPPGIKSIAIVDRSLPEDNSLNRLEALASMEGTKLTKSAKQNVLNGLVSSLSGPGGYNVIIADDEFIGSARGEILPEPLPWEMSAGLAERLGSDALVCLEAFNYDFIVSGARLAPPLSAESGASGLAKVSCGFRMYWPARQYIVDDFIFSETMEWSAGGGIIATVINTARIRQDAVNKAGREAGLLYGERITPNRVRISREFYKRGKGNADLAAGARMMQLNDWDRAIELLNNAVSTGKRKARGKAAHNLAVVYEILGDLHVAKDWTGIAWGVYKARLSKDYGYILTRRINTQERLNEQLKRQDG